MSDSACWSRPLGSAAADSTRSGLAEPAGAGATDPVLIREDRPKYPARRGVPASGRRRSRGRPEAMARSATSASEVARSAAGSTRKRSSPRGQWRFKPGATHGRASRCCSDHLIRRAELTLPDPMRAPSRADAEFFEGAARLITPSLPRRCRWDRAGPSIRRSRYAAKIEGVVEVDVVVGPDGTVTRARVAEVTRQGLRPGRRGARRGAKPGLSSRTRQGARSARGGVGDHEPEFKLRNSDAL